MEEELLKQILDELKWQSKVLEKLVENFATVFKPRREHKVDLARQMEPFLGLLKGTPLGPKFDAVLKQTLEKAEKKENGQ